MSRRQCCFDSVLKLPAFFTWFAQKKWSCAHPWQAASFLPLTIQNAAKPAFPH